MNREDVQKIVADALEMGENADLYGADLYMATGILVIGLVGTRKDMLYAVAHDYGPRV